MPRNRASAKKAGSSFESLIARGLAEALDDDRIERRVKRGNRDCGDIAGLRLRGERVVVECKNQSRLDLPAWTREAQIEAGHDDALVGVVCHKRHGSGQFLDQWVSMTMADFLAVLTGQRIAD